MQLSKVRFVALAICLLLPLAALTATANVLVNPGFEFGLNGWTVFGNAFVETAEGDQFVPYEGNALVSMYGLFSGGLSVSGIFQEFPTSRNTEWSMSCKTRHWSGDALTGDQASGGNWMVQKLAFFDGNGNEVGGVESIVLDGSFATDTWFDNASIIGVAPTRTASVQVLVLFLQPLADGGAGHVDNVFAFTNDPVPADERTWGEIKALYR